MRALPHVARGASEAGSRLRGIAPLPPVGGLLARIEVFVRDAVQLAPTGLATAVLPAAMLVAGAGGPLLGDHVQSAPPSVAIAAPGGDGPRSATTRSAASRPPGDAGTGTAATGDAAAGRRLVGDAATVAVPSARRAPVAGVAAGTGGRRTPGDPPALRPTLPTVGGALVVGRPVVPVTLGPPSGEPATGGSEEAVGERPELPADAAGGVPDPVEVPAAPVRAAQGAVGAVAQTAQGAVTLVHGVVVTTVQGAVAAAGAVVTDATDAAAATGQAAVTTVGQVAAPAVTNIGAVVTTVTRRATPQRPPTPERRTPPRHPTTPQRRTAPPPAPAAAPDVPAPPADAAPPAPPAAPAPAAPAPPPVDAPAVVAPAAVVGDAVDGAATTVGGVLQPLLSRPGR